MKAAGLQPTEDPAHLYWKYWQDRPDWAGSRSFVLTKGTEILAHGAVVPGTCTWEGARHRVIHMIDWAARPDEIGAGVVLMKHIGRLSDFLLGVGGSDDTLKLMPLIGYQRCGEVAGYVRSVSALALGRRVRGPSWKVAGRVARSALWSITAPSIAVHGWRARRIGESGIGDLASLPAERPGLAVFNRDEGLFRHMLGCPIVPTELFVLENDGRVGGYFVMSYAPGQARLADAWMASEDPTEWCALIGWALRRAKAKTDSAELVTWSSEPTLTQALETCGFRRRLTLPIYLRSSQGAAVPKATLRVQMLENDAPYLKTAAGDLWA